MMSVINFGFISILTHLAYIANGKKIMFYSATIHWAELLDANCRPFDVILPIVLVLDGVMLFLRIKNV